MSSMELKRSIRFFLVGAMLLLHGCTKSKSDATEALTPMQALASFELEPGFEITLLAHEPLIQSPVDMEIDEYGRMYVAEMPGYPLDDSFTGRIKLLQDKDGDGQMDKSIVFAENLRFPSGMLRWKDGLIVTDAPYVLYLEDSDGDGRSDRRDTLLTGFSLSNPHVNVNNPVYGLDNSIYLAHFGSIGTRKYEEKFGDTGSEILFPGVSRGPRLPQNANGKRVRFHPEKHKLEMMASRTQFGQTFDRWGRSILTHNQNHIYHEVIDAAYLGRNPDLLITDATESISDHGNETEVFQITTNPDRQLFTPVGLTTSSSGVTAYLGGIFPAPFDGNAVFVAESVSNLVHVDLLEEHNATFVAKRHRKAREFLASKDHWSRPVNMYIGPDGALYVLDYYRRIIEHPEWMSDEAVAAGGLYDGHDKGRIYRIVPVGTPKPAWTQGVTLGDESAPDLVKHLASPNIWWRLNAQRLLVDRSDPAAVPALFEMVKNAGAAEGRLHALWTLEGMGHLTPEIIRAALKDSVAGVRENAIKLAELHLRESPALETSLLELKTETDARARFQLLCTLGFIDTPASAKLREELLFRDFENEWMHVAALTGPSSHISRLLNVALNRYDSDVLAYGVFIRRVTSMIAAGEDAGKVQYLLQKALSPHANRGWQSAILEGLAEGLKHKKEPTLISNAQRRQLAAMFFDHPDETVRLSSLSLLQVVGIDDEKFQKQRTDYAMSVAQDRAFSNQKRIEALRFLLLGDVPDYAGELAAFLVSGEDLGVQVAALQALSKIPGTGVSTMVLDRWQSFTPELREAALETFLQEPDRVRLLIEALESSKVAVEAIHWNRRVALMNYPNDTLRDKARKLLTKDDAEKVNRDYQQALTLEGNVSAGRLVYEEKCSSCHQIRGEGGVEFGPDLGTVHNWHSKDVMANILDPDLSIAQRYDVWEIALRDDKKLQGMIMAESPSAISLRIAPGNEVTINRQNIVSIRGMNVSLMPPMAGQLDHQQMADLLRYLRSSN